MMMITVLLDLRRRLVLLVEAVEAVGGMAAAEGLDVVLERSLVLEIGATDAVP